MMCFCCVEGGFAFYEVLSGVTDVAMGNKRVPRLAFARVRTGEENGSILDKSKLAKLPGGDRARLPEPYI